MSWRQEGKDKSAEKGRPKSSSSALSHELKTLFWDNDD